MTLSEGCFLEDLDEVLLHRIALGQVGMELESCADHISKGLALLSLGRFLRRLELARLDCECLSEDPHIVNWNLVAISEGHHGFGLVDVIAELLAPLLEFINGTFFCAHHVLEHGFDIFIQVAHVRFRGLHTGNDL